MAKNGIKSGLQYIGGVSYAVGTELEERTVSLPAETWAKLDALIEVCPSANHRNPETHLEWVIHVFLFLSSYDERFARGILPKAPNTEKVGEK